MWKLFLCSPLWKDTNQSGMRIDCWLTAPHRKDKMTGQDRRDKVFKTYIDRPTYKWIWEVTTQLKDAVSVVSPINTMQHTVDGERTESKTLEATLSAVRISFKESLCYLCLFQLQMFVFDKQEWMEITAVVCQNNPQATEEMVWKGRNFFKYSTGAFIQLPVPLLASHYHNLNNCTRLSLTALCRKFIKRRTILYKDNLWWCRNNIFCKNFRVRLYLKKMTLNVHIKAQTNRNLSF